MSEPLLKPRASYEIALNDRAKIAVSEAAALVSELERHRGEFLDHGYSIEKGDTFVAVKRGALDIVRVSFNHADSGVHRVVNGVAEALDSGIYVDFQDPAVARHEFKVQLQHATDLFYRNRDRLQALGLV